jgi:secreted PhoX family phosphatase
VFEVPAGAPGPVEPVPLRGLGRFVHEAAAVHPNRKIVYLTEDRRDGLFYRFVANVPGRLAEGGRLQALALDGDYKGVDARNWSKRKMPVGLEIPVRWIDLGDGSSPSGADDLRKRGHAAGATRLAHGEGIHFGFGEVFVCLTSGGAIKSGQIMRYRPSPNEGEGRAREEEARATLELFFESNDPATFNFGDNLAVAPNGHLVICEDPYWGGRKTYLPRLIDGSAPCFLRGVTPHGEVYDIARLHGKSELAGACFSPDGRTLFVNVMSPTRTVAIWAEKGSRWGEAGPWGPKLPGWKIPEAKAAVS